MNELIPEELLEELEAFFEAGMYPPIDVLVSRVERGHILDETAYTVEELFNE